METYQDFDASVVVDSISNYEAQFTTIPGWLSDFSKDHAGAFAFYFRFRICFGGMVAGVFKRQDAMAEQMGLSVRQFQRYMNECITVGAISRGRRHRKWAGNIYFFNAHPFQNDEVAATYHLTRDYSDTRRVTNKGAGQIEFTSAPVKTSSADITACTTSENAIEILAKFYGNLMVGQESLARGFVATYLHNGGLFKSAVNALYELRAKNFRISQKAFDAGLKESHNYIPNDALDMVNLHRDQLNTLKIKESQEAANAKGKAQAKAQADEYREFRKQKQLEEASVQETVSTEEEKLQAFIASVDTVDIEF